jgi:hypothetical protein
MVIKRRSQRKPIGPEPSAAFRRFSRYKEEGPSAQRSISIRQEKVLGKLMRAYHRYLPLSGVDLDFEQWTNAVLGIVENIKYSARDVERFSMLVSSSGDSDTSRPLGWFLSGLINACSSRSLRLRNGADLMAFFELTLWSPKTVAIQGDAIHLGTCMSDGCFIVHGDVFSVGERMSGGTITVNGNLPMPLDKYDSNSVGNRMSGGRIHVKGNLLDDDPSAIGENMCGGRIDLEGEVNGASEEFFRKVAEHVKHGRIFHKGRLIVDK